MTTSASDPPTTAVQWTSGRASVAPCASFGEALRAMRRAAGLSQRELAERIGSTQSAVARLEAGATEPRLCTLEKLVTALQSDLLLRIAPAEATS